MYKNVRNYKKHVLNISYTLHIRFIYYTYCVYTLYIAAYTAIYENVQNKFGKYFRL